MEAMYERETTEHWHIDTYEEFIYNEYDTKHILRYQHNRVEDESY